MCNPKIVRCEIHGNELFGISVSQEGRGVFTECDIHDNTQANVAIKEGSDPQFVSSQIRSSQDCGVRVLRQGRGTFTPVQYPQQCFIKCSSQAVR